MLIGAFTGAPVLARELETGLQLVLLCARLIVLLEFFDRLIAWPSRASVTSGAFPPNPFDGGATTRSASTSS